MADTTKALQTSRNDLETTEGTRPGRVLTPAVDIFENEGAITILADMPGVMADELGIDLNEGVLTITGHCPVVELEGETEVFREYEGGTYQRRFTLGQSIDQERIAAKLVDGVLRLELPKVDRAKPRRIEVATG